jgi:hypothetical protein
MDIRLILVIFLLLALPLQAQDNGYPDVSAVPCADLGPNEICFGQAPVELLVNCEMAPAFDAPDERLSLEAVCVVRTQESGVALIHLRPDVHSVYLAAVGTVEMQSVSSGEVGMEAVLEAEANIYSGPGSQYAVVGSLEAGTAIFVNACNCTRNWLRIMQADGTVGWIPARRVSLDHSALPEVTVDTPVYAIMQAFTLSTGASGSGLLIQVQDAPVPLQINGVQLDLDSTAFVRALPGEVMEIDVLAGQGRITAGGRTLQVPAGGHVLIPLTERNVPADSMQVELYEPDHAAGLPLALLPQPVDPLTALDETRLTVVGVEQCQVISGRGTQTCPLQFINPDGDAIAALEAAFVYAPLGQWEDGRHESPALLAGSMAAGTLGWEVACTLGRGDNFIGPVEWLITLEDVAGHRSSPFKAAFNCIDG